MAGTTLALDFPDRGRSTRALLDRLDRIVVEAGGRIYPAKDGRAAPEVFARSFPCWSELQPLFDPGLDSSFRRRVAPGARRQAGAGVLSPVVLAGAA
jgi:hypothetical protein